MQSSGTRYNADNMNRHMLPAGTNPQELPDSLVTFRTAADFFKIRKTGSLFCPDQMDSINLAKPVRHFELIEGGFSKMQFVLDEMRKRYLETGIQQGIQQGEKQGMKKAFSHVAEKLLEKGGMSVQEISELTEIPVDQILEMKKEL